MHDIQIIDFKSHFIIICLCVNFCYLGNKLPLLPLQDHSFAFHNVTLQDLSQMKSFNNEFI